tara:strand:- start:1062 stop:1688 length:627 start_codon:yes stop_codon:yes gene_type:complete
MIAEIIIPNFIHRIKLSSTQAAKYYVRGAKKKLPKKYLDTRKYGYKLFTSGRTRKFLLVDLKTGRKVIANPIAINKPNYLVIGGNSIYSGNMHFTERSKIVNLLKLSFKPYLKHVPFMDYPVRIESEIHMPYAPPNTKWGSWDLGNMSWIYGKILEDTLTDMKKYPDDNVQYVTQTAMGGLFVPVEKYEDRKLVYRIFKDERSCLLKK